LAFPVCAPTQTPKRLRRCCSKRCGDGKVLDKADDKVGDKVMDEVMDDEWEGIPWGVLVARWSYC
jgi:hypothetical protein